LFTKYPSAAIQAKKRIPEGFKLVEAFG